MNIKMQDISTVEREIKTLQSLRAMPEICELSAADNTVCCRAYAPVGKLSYEWNVNNGTDTLSVTTSEPTLKIPGQDEYQVSCKVINSDFPEYTAEKSLTFTGTSKFPQPLFYHYPSEPIEITMVNYQEANFVFQFEMKCDRFTGKGKFHFYAEHNGKVEDMINQNWFIIDGDVYLDEYAGTSSNPIIELAILTPMFPDTGKHTLRMTYEINGKIYSTEELIINIIEE